MSRLRRRRTTTGTSSVVATGGGNAPKKQRRTLDLAATSTVNGGDDHSIASQSSDEHERYQDGNDDAEEEETLDAKKVRMAREYLRKLEADDDDDDDDDDEGDSSDSHSSSSDEDDDEVDDEGETQHDRIGHKLQRERLKRDGTLERAVADKVHASLNRIRTSAAAAADDPSSWVSSGHVQLFRGHDLTPTCVALEASGEHAISGSKDHSVMLWDVQEQRRSLTLCPNWKHQTTAENGFSAQGDRTRGEVLSVACSDDGRYAAVGRRDATVYIYDVRSNAKNGAGNGNLVQTFRGHKGPVTTLCFRTQSLQLFSGSDDRCLRHYNLTEMMYLETLYGHQFGVTGVDCHRKERPVSVGRDRTARVWKIAEDTHLIFRGGAKVSSADCVRVMKDDWFLSGHDDGHLALWMTEKKRAVATVDFAHGMDEGHVGRGVSSIGSLRGSDLAVTGSYDGFLRLWKAETGATLDSRGLHTLDKIPLKGHVNGIAVGPKARFCVVAVGQEPKLGRWNRVAGAKNRFGIVHLRADKDAADDGDEGEVDEEIEGRSQSDDSSDGEDSNDD